MTLKEYYISRIVEFVRRESPEIYKLFKPNELRDRVSQYMDFNSIVVIWDKNEIASVCVFTINELICDVHHAIVGKKYRYKTLLKQMIIQGRLRYPWVTHLKFDRELKYKDKPSRLIPINKFLGV